ncbi:MAG: alanyl-tRNA editing protein [Salaquimonas sp.]|nr:alanyl-tRNA editing protein [Salaquimonas sp.]
MPFETRLAFLDDAYQTDCEGTVLAVNDRGGIILDATNFYATSGGQPGDTGWLERSDGSKIAIAATVSGETKQEIVLVPAAGEPLPEIGEKLIGHIDWERRHKLMRMHTACHILSVVCPYPITSANVGEEESRVDFDLPEAGVTKEDVTTQMMALVAADQPVYASWISEAEFDANPDIVKSKNVRPPRGAGRIRLVAIGEDASVDSQPCGGTHVAKTGEVGEIHIGKIEKKGRENRRFRIRFGPLPVN